MSIETEEVVPLKEAIKFFRGPRPHYSAIWRWCTKGVGPGRGARLEHIRVYGKARQI